MGGRKIRIALMDAAREFVFSFEKAEALRKEYFNNKNK
mgnify:FL=1